MRRITAFIVLAASVTFVAAPASANTTRTPPYDQAFGNADPDRGLVWAVRTEPGYNSGQGGFTIQHRIGGTVRVQIDTTGVRHTSSYPANGPSARLCARVRAGQVSVTRCNTLQEGSDQNPFVDRDFNLPSAAQNWSFDAYVTTGAGSTGYAVVVARIDRISVTSL